jgi:hypothetical protein
MQTIAALVAEWIILVFIAGVGAIVLIRLWSTNLSGLLSEPADTAVVVGAPAGGVAGAAPPAGGTAAGVVVPGKASMSRLQLLLFTFVIAGLYLTLSLEAGYLIEIPNQVLGLLGISGASYVVSKGIQQQANKP